MQPILVKERKSGQIIEEQVFGELLVKMLYNKSGSFLRECFCRSPLVSRLYGWWQKQSWTKGTVQPFINKYHIDSQEFEKQDFASFNDFFTRHLKEECRPIAYGDKVAVIPADGRYRFFPTIHGDQLFDVKDHRVTLGALLKSDPRPYIGGSMVIARLCPVDYHRFHFPVSGHASVAREIPGALYSVNPWALQCAPDILMRNKRMITEIDSPHFGKVLFLEIGATCVGTIIQTYQPGQTVIKGQEKGYFSFGGSCLIMLFEKGRITFDADLLDSPHEIYCQMGQSLGGESR